MANPTAAAPAWQTVVTDSLGFVLLVWSIPVAILLVGAPIALGVGVVDGFIRWMMER